MSTGALPWQSEHILMIRLSRLQYLRLLMLVMLKSLRYLRRVIVALICRLPR